MSSTNSASFIELQTRLLDRSNQLRAEISAGLSRSRAESTEAASEVHDLGDEAFADLSADVAFTEVRRDVAELRDVEAALHRITTGTYGTCVDCKQPIPLARLNAYPTAKRCLSCQAALNPLQAPVVHSL